MLERGHFNDILQMPIISSKTLYTLDTPMYRAHYWVIMQWRIQEFQNGGGAVEFLGLGFVLMPLHTYPMCSKSGE